jgi:DNA-binding transcriptional ArsR family regulator
MNDLDGTLSALADPNRRVIVDLLRAGPKRAGQLALALGASGPAASRHLRMLERSGLIEVASDPDDARIRLYNLRLERFEELSLWLAQVCQFWTGQLDSFKKYAEQKAGTRVPPHRRRTSPHHRPPKRSTRRRR